MRITNYELRIKNYEFGNSKKPLSFAGATNNHFLTKVSAIESWTQIKGWRADASSA